MERNEMLEAVSDKSKLTPRQARAVLALLEHTTLEEAAKAAAVSKTTLWRWLQVPDFQAAYMQARRESPWRACRGTRVKPWTPCTK
jgi:hypothetical protein